MKFYQLDTLFSFGKHEGKTLLEVCMEDEEYISWCLTNLDHFYISDEVILQLRRVNPELSISTEAIQARDTKYDKWVEQEEEKANYEPDDYDHYGTSYEKYGGYNGWSDDVIDDAFEGDPENTWNVD